MYLGFYIQNVYLVGVLLQQCSVKNSRGCWELIKLAKGSWDFFYLLRTWGKIEPMNLRVVRM